MVRPASNPTPFTALKTDLPPGAEHLPSVVHDALSNKTRLVLERQNISFADTSIKLSEAGHLYRVVERLRPTNCAEIGFCQGVSSIAILQAMADTGSTGKHYVVDPFQSTWWKNCAVENVEKAGLSNRLVFHEKFPEEVTSGFPLIQFGFIDGSHLFDLSILDFILLDKRLEVGGVLGFHDMWMPALQRLVRYVLTNRDYEAYCEVAAARPVAGWKRGLKNALAPVCRTAAKVRALENIFNARLLLPLWTFGIEGNMVFIRKTGEDKRDYKDYREF